MGEVSHIEPFPKKLYERCVLDGVAEVRVSMSGGSDQGYHDIGLTHKKGWKSKDNDLEADILEWAENVYDYNGAGDGSDYGDDVFYNIETKTASHTSWCMARTETDEGTNPFGLEDEDEVDEDEDEEEDEE